MKRMCIYRCNLPYITQFCSKNLQAHEFLSPIKSLSCVQHIMMRHCSMETNRKKTFLVAGLGNHDLPGSRHSVGMLLVHKLAGFLGITLVRDRDCLGFVGQKELSYIHLVLLKPKQPMNINGPCVQKTARKYNVPVTNIYIVHDDLDRKVGKVSLKATGSAGGHNGVKSVIRSFKTDAITRMRVGIDRPASVDMVLDYVLQNFNKSEQIVIDGAIDKAILRIAQHIGARTEMKTARVFRAIEDTDVTKGDAAGVRNTSDVTAGDAAGVRNTSDVTTGDVAGVRNTSDVT